MTHNVLALHKNNFSNMKKIIVFIFVLLPQIVFSQSTSDSIYQRNVIHENLPSFSPLLSEQMTYPLSWLSGNFSDFTVWRTTARVKVMECLLKPPFTLPFHPVVIAEEDRGSYVARKIVFNITADSRALGYLLIPKGNGPFPAVLLFHDHGAKFDIGKEKVVLPFHESPERIKSAQEWVEKLYGGRFIGDLLCINRRRYD